MPFHGDLEDWEYLYLLEEEEAEQRQREEQRIQEEEYWREVERINSSINSIREPYSEETDTGYYRDVY